MGILSKEFWTSLRKSTIVRGDGKGQCAEWCEDALKVNNVQAIFHEEQAVLGEIQIDQYATSLLVHHWLEGRVKGHRYVADGTAGQFTEEHADGFYGFFDQAPEQLKVVYQRKVSQ